MDKNTFISVRLTSGSIRIFKEVIRLMDNPKFIRFSVNKEGTLMAVEPYHKKTFTSFVVPKDLYSYNGGMVVYSKSLCALLYNKLDWNEDKLYRIPGKVLETQKAAICDLTKAVCYNGNSHNKEF